MIIKSLFPLNLKLLCMPRSFCGCRAFTVSRNLSHSYLERKTPAQCLSIAAQPVRGLLEMAIRSQQNMYLQFLAQTDYTHVLIAT